MLTVSTVGTPSMVDTPWKRSTFHGWLAGSENWRSIGRKESAATVVTMRV